MQGGVSSVLSGAFRDMLEGLVLDTPPNIRTEPRPRANGQRQSVFHAAKPAAPRPATVSEDIGAVSEKKIVSGLLAAGAFRDQLEGVFRVPQTPATLIPRRRPVMTVATPSADVDDDDSDSDWSDFSSDAEEESREAGRLALSTPVLQAPQQRAPAPQALSTNQQAPRQQQSNPPPLLQIQYMVRETIETDLQQLEADHLVTSLLTGDFRERLENHIRSRIMAISDPHQRTLRRTNRHMADILPTSYTIPAQEPAPAPRPREARVPPQADDTRPATRTRADIAASEDIRAIGSKVDELSRVVPLLLDLQMDMQRALRQEIASMCYALATSECKRCTRHRRQKRHPDISSSKLKPDLRLSDCMCIDSSTGRLISCWLQCRSGRRSSLKHAACVSCVTTTRVSLDLITHPYCTMLYRSRLCVLWVRPYVRVQRVRPAYQSECSLRMLPFTLR